MYDNESKLVLFIGDSITDAGRNREDPSDLGRGYVLIATSLYQSMFPEEDIRFLNRGIGGNRVSDLRARWKEDCIDLQPSLVSILIGINDTWRHFDGGSTTGTEEFEEAYRDILKTTVESTGARLVLMEPFVLPYPEDRTLWRKDLDPKIHVVRELAREFGAALVPLDGLFAQASARREPRFWAEDGVHPTPAGHAMIARAWLDAVGTI